MGHLSRDAAAAALKTQKLNWFKMDVEETPLFVTQ